MQKGQTSIEFIFLILIIVIYLFTLTKPMIDSTNSAFNDIETVTKTNNETLKLVNSITRINSMASGSKETIYISLPTNGKIICHEDGNIEQIAKINSITNNTEIKACKNNSCDKNYNTQNTINCGIVQIEENLKIIIKKETNIISINKG